MLKTETVVQLQKENPNLFNRYVQQGIIKVSPEGKPEFNPTLAQEVLERGLFGSANSMFRYAYLKMLQLESEIRARLAGLSQKPLTKTGTFITNVPPEYVKLSGKKDYIQLLNEIKDQFSKQGGGFFSERVADARILISKLKQAPGENVTPIDLLVLRRFLDSMRNLSSFRLNPQLAPRQEAYKIASDRARAVLNKIPGIGELMNEYRIWIEATDAIINYAVKTGNRRILNLTDMLLGGGGLAAGELGTGLGLATAIRAFQLPASLTTLAQGLYRLGQFPEQVAEPIRRAVKFGIGRGFRALGREFLGEEESNEPASSTFQQTPND
jgi:hypothetical protein